MAKTRLYRKLPGTGRRFLSALFYQLYLGPDHLLKVDSTRITERYRRFYFSDIQGFSVQKTRKGMIFSIVFMMIAALFAAGAFSAREEVGGMYALLGVSGFFLIFAVLNFFFGPTCRANLFTAVSNEELPSLNRLRRTRKVLARLTPLIEEAQGGRLDPERYEVGTEPFESPLPPPGRAGLLVAINFAAVLLLAAALGFDLMVDQIVLTLAIIALMMGGLVLTVVSLIQAYQRRVRKGLIVSTWLGGIFCTVVLLLLYGLAIYVQIQNIGVIGTTIDSLRHLSALSAQEHGWLAGLLISISALGFLTGAFGFFYLRPLAPSETANPS